MRFTIAAAVAFLAFATTSTFSAPTPIPTGGTSVALSPISGRPHDQHDHHHEHYGLGEVAAQKRDEPPKRLMRRGKGSRPVVVGPVKPSRNYAKGKASTKPKGNQSKKAPGRPQARPVAGGRPPRRSSGGCCVIA
jgi:hypothetical protein